MSEKIKLKSVIYITTEDVETLVPGPHWNEFEFAQMAENDSYTRLDCSDAGLEELYADLTYEEEVGNIPQPEDFEDSDEYNWKSRHCRASRLRNQIQLVERLRKEYGVMFEILVWVCW